MRVLGLVLILLISSLSPVIAYFEPTIDGTDINFRNGDVSTTPIDSMPNDFYDGFWVLTHEYPIPSTWTASLSAAGVDCWSYLPPNAFHCELNGQSGSELAHLGVEGMLYMPAKSKVHPDVMPALNGDKDVYFIAEGIGVLNLVLSGEQLPEEIFDRNDIQVLSHDWRWATVEAQTSAVEWLSHQSEIEWIEPKYEMKILNDEADSVMGADVLQSTTQMAGINAAWNGLDGTGVIVAVADTGLDNGINNSNMHPDFKDHIVGIHDYPIDSSISSFVTSTTSDGASDLDSGHGTHVAGSVLGDGTQSSGSIKGLAPEAGLYMQATEVYTDWTTYAENTYGVIDGYSLTGIPDNLADLYDQAVANGSNIHTNSWGSSVNGQYTTSSMQSDYSARNHTEMLILFAASNDGVDANSDGEIDLDSLGSPASAKNVLTIGASENNRPSINYIWGTGNNPIYYDLRSNNTEGMAAFSSRGPTDDNRQKPDASAPGTDILSARSRSASGTGWGTHANTDYLYMGGTSMATPLTAGAAALLYQHMAVNLNNSNPSSALMKGIIVTSARDMTGQYGSATNGAGEPAPNSHEGWGLVDLDRAVNTSWLDGDSVNTGDSLGWRFTVPNSAPDLKIMLSWTDPASTTAAATNLVNDLDFAVKDPSGTWTEFGNDLDNIFGGTVSSPTAGIWEIYVNGSQIPTGPQTFALVMDAPYAMTNLTTDQDGDGVLDENDDCATTYGTSTEDTTGCPDSDGDGWSNVGDEFPNDGTQWADSDGDYYGDNPGGTNPDSCPSVSGTSTGDRYGCEDSDGDTWSNPDGGWTAFEGADACENTTGTSYLDRNGCLDNDNDGQSNLNDALDNDSSQWLDSDNDGFYDNANPATNWDDCPIITGNSTIDLQGCTDSDGDGVSDVNDQWPNDPNKSIDSDGDGFSDGEDDCVNLAGNSTYILIGCLDVDGDGRTIEYDIFPSDSTQWEDSDGDNYGDNQTGNAADDCPLIFGTSWQNNYLGCIDSDDDGWADDEDDFTTEPTQWKDSDGDSYGDNSGGVTPDSCPSVAGNSTTDRYGCTDSDGDGQSDLNDALPNDPSQSIDTDGDGYGDNQQGTNLDSCPNTAGNSTLDRYGCVDTDGDGQSDLNDAFPNDPTRAADSDADGFDDLEDNCPQVPGTSLNGSVGCFDADQDSWADQNDSFPLEASQWADFDNDGFGDNADGLNPDDCPVVTGTSDQDRNGCVDTDSDGWSDETDLFLNDPTEWADNDSDGFGDNSDLCPIIAGTATNGSIGCLDSDADSWSDDFDFLFGDSTQWEDLDYDGYGDNSSGTDGDDCPGIHGLSSMDRRGCTDSDGDGWSDEGDAFIDNPSQFSDSDGDGFGDNNQPGAQQADHWPEDASRNQAEVVLSCDNDGFKLDIANISSVAFSCSVTNGIQNQLTVRLEWKAMNAVDAAIRTHVLILDAGETKTVAFAGDVVESGDHTLVIEASEPGADSSMAFVSIPLKAINTDEGDSLSDILEIAENLSDTQEIISLSIVGLLLSVLLINTKLRRDKRKTDRQRTINSMRYQRLQSDPDTPQFGRLPPKF